MKRALIIFVVSLSLLAWTSSIFAQRGMGDHVGVAQEAPRPIVTLEGEICSIETHPCERTTGESSLGTHLILKSTNAELNIHLGPADAVQHVADLMTSGDLVRVRAFQTENMPKNNYAAQSITFEGQAFRLRDENLRPVWASGRSVRMGTLDMTSPPLQSRYGWGRNQGLGFGRGRQSRGGRGRW